MKINFIYMKGVVIKSTGNLCQVLSDDKQYYSCKIKGKTRLMNLEFTNPISVSCEDHATNGPIYIQQWNGSSWERVFGRIRSMDRETPILEKAASEYKAKNNLSDRTIPCS